MGESCSWENRDGRELGVVLLPCGAELVFPALPDDVFLPKDLDGVEMDETDREVEYFKR